MQGRVKQMGSDTQRDRAHNGSVVLFVRLVTKQWLENQTQIIVGSVCMLSKHVCLKLSLFLQYDSGGLLQHLKTEEKKK